jgi:hypothetical protein
MWMCPDTTWETLSGSCLRRRRGTVIVQNLSRFGCYEVIMHALMTLERGGADVVVASELVATSSTTPGRDQGFEEGHDCEPDHGRRGVVTSRSRCKTTSALAAASMVDRRAAGDVEAGEPIAGVAGSPVGK